MIQAHRRRKIVSQVHEVPTSFHPCERSCVTLASRGNFRAGKSRVFSALLNLLHDFTQLADITTIYALSTARGHLHDATLGDNDLALGGPGGGPELLDGSDELYQRHCIRR